MWYYKRKSIIFNYYPVLHKNLINIKTRMLFPSHPTGYFQHRRDMVQMELIILLNTAISI